MKKFFVFTKFFILVMSISIFICGCSKVITGEMVTEGKVVLIGNKAVQQERMDGKQEYVDNITNLPAYREQLSNALQKRNGVKIFWTVEKFTATNIQNNTIKKIE